MPEPSPPDHWGYGVDGRGYHCYCGEVFRTRPERMRHIEDQATFPQLRDPSSP